MPRVLPSIKSAAALAVAALAMASATAQEKYPSRPIEMVIPTAAGGGTDISLRMLAELVEPALGQKIVVVNKTGGGGTVGMAGIVSAKPDGYTIGGLWNAPLTMTPHMLPAPYKPSDYAAVSLVTWAPTILCVKAAFPANDGKAFIDELKKNPNKYTYGNDGLGGTLHLASERVFQKLGVKARPIPFAGAGETLKAFLGDHIDIYAGSISPILPYVKDKSAKCLMLTSPERNATVPDAAASPISACRTRRRCCGAASSRRRRCRRTGSPCCRRRLPRPRRARSSRSSWKSAARKRRARARPSSAS